MRRSYSNLLLIIGLLITVSLSWSVITDYTFSSTLGTYTEITGGTVYGTSANDNEVFNDITIGFDFDYNGTDYTNVSIATNGFIAMGPAVTSSNTAISTGASNNVIAVLNRDIRSRDDGELSSLLSGTAPNRVFTIQWKSYRRYPTAAANDTLNFQIQLHETSNAITYNYGHFFAANVTTAATVQVGLRGADNTEYINRATTTDWTATTAGTANNASCRMNDTIVPPNGLIFTWSPPQAGTPPFPAQIISPLNGATNVSTIANLVWLSGGGTPTGYKVYFGTDNPPTNIENGTLQTDTSYNPDPDLAYNTVYYWKIVPTNDFGDALDCPVWSFTSMADPTITVFPYTQNWDAVTPPAVPPSWTIVNANSDNFTWITVASGANSAPNVLRCSYNSSSAIAMDDWAISPPMQLAADTYYRIEFYYKAQSATLPEKLEVKYGTANNPAALTEQIFVNNNITNTNYVMGEAYIPPTAGGIHYFGFHGYSNANMYYLFIDDVTVSQVAVEFNPPTNLTGVFGASNVMLLWQSPTGSTPSGYNVFRNDVQINTTPVTSLSYTDDSPAAGLRTYYVTAVYTNPNGESVASNTVTGELLKPVTDLQYSVSQNNVSLTWSAPGGPILQDWIHYDDGTNYAGIGTGNAANFDVAARFTQTELSGITDRYLTKMRFVPNQANCVYTVKVWTGGTSPTNPGTLAVTVPVTDPVIGEWNVIDLPAPIQIPSTGELWVGYNSDTQTGHPAGCDDGPSIPYKGNVIYWDNAWTILTELSATLDYNWNIQAFVVNYIGKESQLVHLPEPTPPTISAPLARQELSAVINTNRAANSSEKNDRPLTGYKVFRDGELIATINDIVVCNYTDTGLPNGTYIYEVTAVYTTGESAPCDPVFATVFVPLVPTFFEDGFETYDDFALTFGNWMLTDVDNSATYGFSEYDFENEYSPMAYMIFNPSATTPPMTDLAAHTGDKMAASFAATTPPNNDWLITPRVRFGTADNSVSFWAKSYTADYGLERFKVGVSVNAAALPATFVTISGATYVEAPVEWTEFTFPIPASYNMQFGRVGIKCESNDAFIFLVDDFKLLGISGVAGEDEVMPVVETALRGNYPNPFNPETTIMYSVKSDEHVTIEIFNLKGQKVRTLVNEKAKAGNYKVVWHGDDNNGKTVGSGVYFYRMNSGKFTSTKKMIMMK